MSGACFGVVAVLAIGIANSAPTVDSVIVSANGVSPLLEINNFTDGDAVAQTFSPVEGGSLIYVYGEVTDSNTCSEVNTASGYSIEFSHNGVTYPVATADITLSGCAATGDISTHYVGAIFIPESTAPSVDTADFWMVEVAVTDSAETPGASAPVSAEFEIGQLVSSNVGGGNMGVGFVTNTHSTSAESSGSAEGASEEAEGSQEAEASVDGSGTSEGAGVVAEVAQVEETGIGGEGSGGGGGTVPVKAAAAEEETDGLEAVIAMPVFSVDSVETSGEGFTEGEIGSADAGDTEVGAVGTRLEESFVLIEMAAPVKVAAVWVSVLMTLFALAKFLRFLV